LEPPSSFSPPPGNSPLYRFFGVVLQAPVATPKKTLSNFSPPFCGAFLFKSWVLWTLVPNAGYFPPPPEKFLLFSPNSSAISFTPWLTWVFKSLFGTRDGLSLGAGFGRRPTPFLGPLPPPNFSARLPPRGPGTRPFTVRGVGD